MDGHSQQGVSNNELCSVSTFGNFKHAQKLPMLATFGHPVMCCKTLLGIQKSPKMATFSGQVLPITANVGQANLCPLRQLI